MPEIGDHVRVVAGPLEAHDGVVVALEGAKIIVDVEIFSRAVRLNLPAEDLTVVPVEGDTWQPSWASPAPKESVGTGSKSWRFAESVDELPHIALYVRDVLGLEFDDKHSLPPRLAGHVPDHSNWLDESERRRIGSQWVSWWEEITESAAAPRDFSADHGGKANRPQSPDLDPSEWQSLTNHPELRRAVIRMSDEANRFAHDARLSLITASRQHPVFPHDVLRRAANSIAAETGVGIGTLAASASVIRVNGPWWRLLRPGEIICSPDVAHTEDRGYRAIRAAFSSVP